MIGTKEFKRKGILKKCGGTIELRNKWCESITKQIGFAKHKSATGLVSEIGHTFYHNIDEIVIAH